MIETAGAILIFIGKGLMWLWSSVAIIAVVGIVVYRAYYKKYGEYKEAKEEIFRYVKKYKRRCTGNNVFPVTVENLQDAFREYDTVMIEKVHNDLITEHIIQWDVSYQEWCVK